MYQPIRSISQTEEFLYWRVQPWRYEDQAILWYQKTGISLPTAKEAEAIGNFDRLRVLIQETTITIEYKNSKWYQYKFLPGFLWDGGSVPRIARVFVDDNDIDCEQAFAVHDANFGGHYLGDDVAAIEETNTLMEDMIRFRGNRFRAWVAHAGVNSIIGHGIYQHMPERRMKMLSKTVQFASSNPLHRQS